MFETIHNFIELIKKKEELIYLFISQQFIRNSLSWLNIKNLIKAITFCYTKVVLFFKSIFGKRSIQRSPGFILAILSVLLLLKLYNLGIIKVNSDKAIALAFIVLSLGMLSVISKIEYTKAELNE